MNKTLPKKDSYVDEAHMVDSIASRRIYLFKGKPGEQDSDPKFLPLENI